MSRTWFGRTKLTLDTEEIVMNTRTMALATLNGYRLLTSQDAGHTGHSEFYALMPGDNAATIAVGAPVLFPQNGTTDGSGAVTRTSAGVFTFTVTGRYLVMFNVSVTEAGQLVITTGGTELADCVFGRATGTSQISGQSIISVTPGLTLQIRNPTGNSTALTITPIAGGTHAVAAKLTLLRVQ